MMKLLYDVLRATRKEALASMGGLQIEESKDGNYICGKQGNEILAEWTRSNRLNGELRSYYN